MTRNEFETRTGVLNVSNYEFDAIHAVYMASDLDKDEFCKMWCKMNRSRVERAKLQKKMDDKISALLDIKAGYVNYSDMSELAVNYLTQKEQDLLAEFGITMEDINYWGIRYFISNAAMLYRIDCKIKELKERSLI